MVFFLNGCYQLYPNPYLSGADLMNLYQITIAEYHVENTQLYHVVDTCVDLSGNHYESDIDHIKQTFHEQGPPLRDGRGYLQWIEAFNDYTSVGLPSRTSSRSNSPISTWYLAVPLMESLLGLVTARCLSSAGD
eukprot:321624-Prymnesium_polylepis.1